MAYVDLVHLQERYRRVGVTGRTPIWQENKKLESERSSLN